MSLYKKSNSPYWQYEINVEGSRFRGSTRLTGKADAERFVTQLRRDILLGNHKKKQITVSQAFGTWFSHVGQHTATANTVSGQLERLLNSLGANTSLSDVGMTDLRGHIAKRRATVANATVNREIELCRRVWRWTKSNGFEIKELDWGKLRLSEPQERVRSLSQSEEERLLEALPHDLRQVVIFALMTGKRKSEVLNLTWTDIDFDAGRASFRVKGGKTHRIPLTEAMLEHIKAQPKACAQVFTFEARSTSNRFGRKTIKGVRYPFSVSGWSRQWQRALKEAGVDDFRFHDLRHTLATRLLRTTGNLKVVQKVLGHSDISTTTKYAHVQDDDILEALSALTHTIPTQKRDDEKKARKINGLRIVG